jgi:hypothetical protein
MKYVLADSEHDYGVTIQSKAIFQLATEHIKKALKTPLINKGQTESFRTYYIDCERGTTALDKYRSNGTAYAKSVFGCNLIAVSSNDFIKDTSYETFVVVFAMFDPSKDKRNNTWKGFFTQQGLTQLPTITLYCPYDPPERQMGFIQAGELADAYKSGINANAASLKSTFIHEFGHNYNFLQWVDKSKQLNKRLDKTMKPAVPKVKYSGFPNVAPGKEWTDKDYKDYEAYVNDPQEVNSRYLEWIHAIQTSFTRLLRIKNADYDIRRAFFTFHDFWEFYWETEGFVPKELSAYANVKTKKKLARRLYGFYRFLVENPASNPNEVENFIRDQMRKDANVEYTTPAPKPIQSAGRIKRASVDEYELAKG